MLALITEELVYNILSWCDPGDLSAWLQTSLANYNNYVDWVYTLLLRHEGYCWEALRHHPLPPLRRLGEATILSLLTHEDEEVRQAILWRLREYRPSSEVSTDTILAVIRCLDDCTGVQEEAVATLVTLAAQFTPAILEAIAERLGELDAAFDAAVEVLQRIHPQRDVLPFLGLGHDSDVRRYGALRVLDELIPTRQVLEAMVGIAVADPDFENGDMASEKLARKVRQHEEIEAILMSRIDTDRVRVLRTLGHLPRSPYRLGVLKTHVVVTDPEVCLEALYAVSMHSTDQLDFQEWEPILRECWELEHPDISEMVLRIIRHE
jgi:hypothetical protein